MEVIKLIFIKQRLVNSLNECKYIFDHLNEITKNYDILVSYLMDKNIIEQINQFINKLKRVMTFMNIKNNITEKKFLTIWMITTFPEYVLTNNDLSSKNVYNSALELVNYTKNNNSYKPFTIINLINKFVNLFDEFICLDKKRKINELIQKWYSEQIAKEEINKSIKYNIQQKINVIKIINKTENKIKKYILNLDKNFDLDLLDKYKELYDNIAQTTKQAYWDILIIELNNQKYDMLTNLINEIKTNFIFIAPKYKSEFDELFNITIDESLDFINLANICIDKIIFLQAPIKNTDTINKWEYFKKKFNESDNLPLCIANGTKFIIEQINEIKSDIIEFVIMTHLSQ